MLNLNKFLENNCFISGVTVSQTLIELGTVDLRSRPDMFGGSKNCLVFRNLASCTGFKYVTNK
jgi:hypothetical protein